MIYESFSAEDTEKIANEISRKATPGSVFCLTGDLGVGKTVFTKGFAKGLGIEAHVTSPTFTIINEYFDGRLPLYHFDVYRIGSLLEMEDTGYEEYFYGGGVCIVEWAELIKELLPPNAISIVIEKDFDKSDVYRSIKIEAVKPL